MNHRVVLLGGGGHASDLLTCVEDCGVFTEVSVADDGEVLARRFEARAAVLEGGLDDAFKIDAVFLAAIGYPTPRRRVVERADANGVTWTQPIAHTSSTVHRTVRLGSDSVVLGQTWISANVEIGPHSNVGYGVTIGHDTRIGDFAAIMPAATIGGDVTLGDGVLIGANATVLQGLDIGNRAVVGAGAVVTRNVEDGTTVVGVPAAPVT